MNHDERNTMADEQITITVRADDARLMGEALHEMRRDWQDECDNAAQREDWDGLNFSAMRANAAGRVATELHGAGWRAAQART